MRRKSLRASRSIPISVAIVVSWALPAAAQETGAPESGGGEPVSEGRGFERRFIDAASYRDDQVLLYDWPALTALIRWSSPVAEAVGRDDGTLSTELIQEFRQRVEALAASDPPGFLAAEADSVAATLSRIGARLDGADSLAAATLPGSIAEPTGEERANVSDRDRTYATGPTAVRVPAGIDVGEADSLPGASIDGPSGEPTYVDLVAESLAELDALVHMVRKLGEPSTEAPRGAAPTPRAGTEPGPPTP
jgi:hypothetical protein